MRGTRGKQPYVLPRTPRRIAGWFGRNWARLHYARRIEPTWLEVNSLDVSIPSLPEALSGLRIVQLSDFHFKKRLDPNYIRHSIELAQRCEPDLIALTGDFVHKGYSFVEPIAELLGELRAPLGVFAVLGNHDYAVRNALGIRRYPRLHLAIHRSLSKHKIRVLRNESVTLRHNGAELAVAGVDDLWSRSCDVARTLGDVPEGVPRIVLAHNPKTIELLDDHRCDLMLSGHTHGGQVTFGHSKSPLLRRRAFRAGLYCHRGKHLYVNKGIGHGIRLRYRTRPEVALLQLTAAR